MSEPWSESESLTAPFHQLAYEAAQAVNLIDQIEYNWHGLIVHT
jgi:hypothetical protein